MPFGQFQKGEGGDIGFSTDPWRRHQRRPRRDCFLYAPYLLNQKKNKKKTEFHQTGMDI